MSFQKDFDELLDAILTDYRNQFPGIDISQGSLVFIKSACLASALWGLYKHQEWVARQIFPDTADTVNLEHHAWVRGLARTYLETDAALLTRLLAVIRRPPAGGNKYDYEQWALSIDNVAAAWCFPIAQGLGTVDVVILANEANTGSEIPSTHADLTGTISSVTEDQLVDSAATFITSGVKKGDLVKNTATSAYTTVETVTSQTALALALDIFTEAGQTYEIVSLCQQVLDYIDTVRPVTASAVSVLPPTSVSQNVTLTATGTGLDLTAIADDITAYLATLIPTQTLYRAKLVQIAMQNGADNVVVTTPAADVTPSNYGMIRAGTISVT
ncbi:MAG: baseplate J/gp47 family protein [Deltaproteobacteria bacterium]|nr:baseplate J/gp47 family protein [Deltaproteobacteria bacterium]